MASVKVVSCVLLVAIASHTASAASSTETAFRAMKKIYNVCENSDELFNCMKVQTLKLTERALKLPNIKLADGLAIVKREDAYNDNESRSIDIDSENLPSEKLDELIVDRINKFMDTHQLAVSVPRLLASAADTPRLVEEGRKKYKKYMGPFMAALALKGGILTMVYHSIAVVAGKALIIGKIALVISAIIGLKKLVTPGENI